MKQANGLLSAKKQVLLGVSPSNTPFAATEESTEQETDASAEAFELDVSHLADEDEDISSDMSIKAVAAVKANKLFQGTLLASDGKTSQKDADSALENRQAAKRQEQEDINTLWRTYKLPEQANATQQARVREKLILRYLHLVRYVVSRLPMTLPVSITIEDLISFGTMGLMESVERFDLSRGLKFETYAITRIRGAIIDQLRTQDWIPRGVRKRSKALGEAMARLEEKFNRPPTNDELAADLGVTKAKLNTMLADSNNLVLSLDEHWGDDGGSNANSLLDMVEDRNSPSPQSQYETNELRQRLANAINSLPEREKLLIALYYHENMTLKEIGEVISVSESRVCQLHAQAILRLRNKLTTA
jgi:RNA polymerase sigma factor FliA